MRTGHASVHNKPVVQAVSDDLRRILFEQSNDGLFIADPSGRVVEVNSRLAEMFNRSREELLNMSLEELIQGEEGGKVRTLLRNTSGGTNLTMKYNFVGRTGDRRSAEIRAYTTTNSSLIGIVHEITGSGQTLPDLNDSVELARLFTKTIPFGVEIVDASGSILFMNEVLRSLSGGRGFGLKCWEMYRDDKVQCSECPLRSPIDVDETKTIEVSGIFGNRVFQIHHTGLLFGGKRALLEIFQDVTEHRRNDERILDLNRSLSRAEQMAHLGAWRIEISNDSDVNANPLRWSDEVYRIFGYAPGELEPTNGLFYKCVHPDDRQRVQDAVARAIAEKRSYSVEHRVVRPDGTERNVLEYADIEYDLHGRPLQMLGAVQDVTEQKRAEARILYLTRLYATLSGVSQTVARARESAELFQSICRVAIEFGGFSLVSIGLAERGSSRMHLAAWSGVGEQEAPYSSMDLEEPPFNRGLSAMAVRTGKVVTSEDVQVDQRTSQWVEEAEERGIHSAAALPLRLKGAVVGVMNISASEVGFFSEEERQLLEEIGENISFGLEKIEVDAERKRVEGEAQLARESAEKSNAQLDSIIQNIADGVVVADASGSILLMNSAALAFHSFATLEEARKHFVKYAEVFETADERGESIPLEEWPIVQSLKGRKVENFEMWVTRRETGICKVGLYSTTVLPDKQGNISLVIITVRDITERKRAQSAVRKQAALIDLSPDATIVRNLDGTITFWSEGAEKLYGWSREEAVGRKVHELIQTAFTEPFDRIIETLRQSGRWKGELIHTTRDGRRLTMQSRWRLEPGTDELMESNVDITERKQAEERVRQSLKEKELLLKEVHHRVKNNMQVISSMLRLQSRAVNDATVKSMLAESQNRIRSMSLVHELLYRTQDLTHIEPHDYINGLVSNLYRSYGGRQSPVKLDLRIDSDLSLDLDTAIPCGLIINELVSNALKYAFPASKEGALRIHFYRIEGGQYRLVVSDNGVGLPKDFDAAHSKTLGLQLVQSLVKELHGAMQTHCDGGTEFTITFSESNYAKRI